MNGQTRAMQELEEMAREGPARPRAVLFGQELDSVDRAVMRAALKKPVCPQAARMTLLSAIFMTRAA